MIDDMGYSGASFRKGSFQTPHMDRLRNEGALLERHYVYKMCSPTRCSFLTGRMPHRVNQEQSSTAQPGAGIMLGMGTIAEKMREAGYATHHVGKWHVGSATDAHIPAGRGFETSLGFFGFAWKDHFKHIRG